MTRIYLPSSGSAAVTPSTWNFPNLAASVYTWAGVLNKISSAFTSYTSATGTTSPIFKGVVRYIIGPLSAVQISGTVNLVIRASESNAGANANIGIAVKIIQPDGTDRSVLLAYTASDLASAPYEVTTTLASCRAYNASEVRPISLTAQTPTAGDYLVIEIGFRSATTTTRNIVHRVGDNSGSDLTDGEGETNDYCPYVDFSQTISWLQTLAIDKSSHGHSAESPALIQAYTIAPQDAAHGHIADNIDLLAGSVTLVVQEAAHFVGGQDNLPYMGTAPDIGAYEYEFMDLEQTSVLTVAESIHAHLAESPVLTQAHILAVAEALHAHAAEEPMLIENKTLIAQEVFHNHTADNVVLEIESTTTLVMQDGLHGHAAENVVLTQSHNLQVAEAVHGHLTEIINLVQQHLLAVAEAYHDHSAESPMLSQAQILSVQEALHDHLADVIELIQGACLTIQDGLHAHTADNISLIVNIFLSVLDGLHTQSSESPTLLQEHILDVEDALHALSADTINLIREIQTIFVYPVHPRKRMGEIRIVQR